MTFVTRLLCAVTLILCVAIAALCSYIVLAAIVGL